MKIQIEGLPPWFNKRLSIRVPLERVEAIIAALDRGRRPVTKERRFHRRYSWRGPRAVLEFALERDSKEKETVLAITRNLSVGGLAFLSSHPLPTREQLSVMPPTAAGLKWPLKALVVRCRQVDVMVYEVGIRFLGRRKGDLLMAPPELVRRPAEKAAKKAPKKRAWNATRLGPGPR